MKRFLTVLLALGVLCLAGCAKQEAVPGSVQNAQPPVSAEAPGAVPPVEPIPGKDDNVTVYTVEGLEIPIPAEYAALLTVDTEPEAWSEHWTPLLSLSETASVEAFALDHPGEDWGMGWLCSVSRLDRIGFEEWASGDSTGASLFARDEEDNYYLLSSPTDVRLYRAGDAVNNGGDIEGLEEWTKLNDWALSLPDAIIARNGLTAYDAGDLFGADYTYGGEHVELGYRIPGEACDLITLSLSQPARQGEGGVWCVERVHYVYSDYGWTSMHLVFPAALGFDETAAEHYAQLQAECDAGEHTELLTARGAALDYARRVTWLFGEDVSATDFELIEALG